MVKGWEKVFHENSDQKEAEVTILIQGTVEFRLIIVTRVKEGHYKFKKSQSIPNIGYSENHGQREIYSYICQN